jgi:DNA-directed RNA polymerase III subunit RPC4
MPPKVQPKQQAARRSNRRAPIADSQDVARSSTSQDSPAVVDDATKNPVIAQDTDDAEQTLSVEPSVGTTQDAPTAAVRGKATRRPVQRLDSLNRRNAVTSSSASGAAGTKPVGLKFQPKLFIRRSKEEREAFARAEEERRQARLAARGVTASTNNVRGGGSGGFTRGGFRGGMSGWRTERRGMGQATGPLSGPSNEGILGGGRGGRGGAGGYGAGSSASTSSRVKKEPAVKVEFDGGGKRTGRKAKETQIKIEDGPSWVSSDDGDDMDGPRINIEHINLISDESSDEATPKGKGKAREKSIRPAGWNLKPIRLDRQEHVERTAGASFGLTSDQLRQKNKERVGQQGPLFVSDDEGTKSQPKKTRSKGKDVEFLSDKRKWKGVYRDEDDVRDSVKVKEEPADDDAMIIDVGEVVPTDTAAPSIGTSELPVRAAAQAPEELEDDTTPALAGAKRRRKSFFGTIKPVLQTEEDHQEWQRYEDDVAALGEELGLTDIAPRAADGDNPMDDKDEDEETIDRRYLLSYLFQFPPIIPCLVDAAQIPEVEEAAAPPAAPPSAPQDRKGKGKASVKKEPAIKIEDDSSNSPNERIPNALLAEYIDDFVGHVGKVTVFQSGHVSVDWGGVAHELAKGAGGELLQEVIVSDAVRVKREPGLEGDDVEMEGGVRKMGMAMGQVSGGFVVTPCWTSLLEGA